MVAAGVGVIISHYPQGRGLCSPVTSGFIELAASCCAMLLLSNIEYFHKHKKRFSMAVRFIFCSECYQNSKAVLTRISTQVHI